MRISDWSSDVCSSDLSDPRQRGRSCRRTGKAVRHDQADGHPELYPAAIGNRRGIAQTPKPLAEAADRRGMGRSFRKTPSPLVAMRQGRSEEHTSELQSLMRISYAVFCLKNKI